MKKLLVTPVFIFFIISTQATVHNVPSQYATIQLGINSCAAFDTVLVDAGTYTENIIWSSAYGIKLMSVSGATATIINGNAAGTVLTINGTGNDSDLVIDGFTITNGSNQSTSAADGGGIMLSHVHPTLRNLIVADNHIGTPYWAYGAGIYGNQANVTMINVQVFRNTIDSGSWSYGAGVHFEYGSIKIYNSEITGNLSNSTSWSYGAGIYLTNCTIEMNQTKIEGNKGFDGAIWYYGAGFYAEETSGELSNVLVADNYLSSTGNYHYGAGISAVSYATVPPVLKLNDVTVGNNTSGSTVANSIYNDGDSLIITNSIIWSSASGTEVSSSNPAQTLITYSDVEGGHAGTGNINSYPLFMSSNDYHLQLSSPCIAAADSLSSSSVDLENNPRPLPAGNNPDMGCYEIDESSNAIVDLAKNDFSFTVYPNPSANKCMIHNAQFTMGATVTIKVYNMPGVAVQSEIQNQKSEMSMDFSTLPAGIYFIQISDGEKTLQQKIVIER